MKKKDKPQLFSEPVKFGKVEIGEVYTTENGDWGFHNNLSDFGAEGYESKEEAEHDLQEAFFEHLEESFCVLENTIRHLKRTFQPKKKENRVKK